MSDTDAPSLDPTLLNSLLREGGRGRAGIANELVEIFRADCAVRIASLGRAIEARDVEQVRQHAHAVKGSSSTLGAARLARLAAVLETGGSDVHDAAHVQEIQQEFSRACALIDAMMQA